MQFNIKTNFPEVAKAMRQLGEDVARKATASALNKTVAQAKTAMSREIRAEFNMTAAKVGAALKVTNARASGANFRLEASLESPRQRGRSLNLANFAAKQTRLGVTFKIKRGGARKLIPGAFLINGGKTVMIRVPGTTMGSRSKYAGTKHAQQIRALQTIDVASMFNTKRVNAKVLAMIEAKFPELFANEAKFFTDRFNRTGKA